MRRDHPFSRLAYNEATLHFLLLLENQSVPEINIGLGMIIFRSFRQLRLKNLTGQGNPFPVSLHEITAHSTNRFSFCIQNQIKNEIQTCLLGDLLHLLPDGISFHRTHAHLRIRNHHMVLDDRFPGGYSGKDRFGSA